MCNIDNIFTKDAIASNLFLLCLYTRPPNVLIIDDNSFNVVEVADLETFRPRYCIKVKTYIVYVAELSNYYNDGKTNMVSQIYANYSKGLSQQFELILLQGRLESDVQKFKKIVSWRCLQTTPIFLIFNKTDVFAREMRELPAAGCQSGPESAEGWLQAAEEYAESFRKVDSRLNGELYVHYINALDDASFLPAWRSIRHQMRIEQR